MIREPYAIEVVRLAREMLDTESAWTQKAIARDAHGRMVSPESPSAVSWCMSGAIRASQLLLRAELGWTSPYTGPLKSHLTAALQPFYMVSKSIPPRYQNNGMSRFNDAPATTYQAVIAAFDKTITHHEGVLLRDRS